MKSALVSIITPTYRHGAVLSDCIESVLSQTYPNWEQIIVDDGSDDETLTVAKQYATRDERIRVISLEHRGIGYLAETYNTALRNCRGELIAILEGDDFWPPEKLSVQVNVHEKHEDLLLSHGVTDIMQNGKRIGQYKKPPRVGLASSLEYERWALHKQSGIMPVSVVLRRSALEQIGGFSQPYGFPATDYPTWLNVFRLDGSVMYIDLVVGHWRQSGTQVTQNRGVELAERALDIALKHYQSIDPERLRQIATSRDEIFANHFRSTLSDSYLGELRGSLLRRDRKQAAYCIRKLVKWGNAKRKAEGIVGLIMLSIGGNMEWIFRRIH